MAWSPRSDAGSFSACRQLRTAASWRLVPVAASFLWPLVTGAQTNGGRPVLAEGDLVADDTSAVQPGTIRPREGSIAPLRAPSYYSCI